MTNLELQALMSAMKQGFFTCFRTGVWVDASGKQHDITQGDLETIEEQYNQKTNKNSFASLFCGHEGKEKAGVISTIVKYGDYLLARAAEVKDEILEKIKKGIYKFVSIAMNPQFEVEHIALTNNPAVEGLLPIQGAFSTDMILFQFEIHPAAGKEKINQLFYPEEIADAMQFNSNKDIKEVPMEPDKEGTEKKESPPDTAAAVTADTANAEFAKKLSTAEKEKADALKKAQEAENKLAEFARQKKQEEISTFTGQLVKEGKLFPNEVEGMKNFILQLSEEKLIQFSNEKSQSEFQFMKDFLSGLNKRIPLDKIDTGKKTAGTTSVCFSRINPEEEDLSLHESALALAKKENIPYLAALTRLDMEGRR